MKKKKARFVFSRLCLIVSILCSMCLTALSDRSRHPASEPANRYPTPKNRMKWVEFNVPYERAETRPWTSMSEQL